ncbi:hypothetical protein EO95_01195 [Methanosarcina sp. 1.H.T.1A.1]|uniref:hypothetical protein n=1 Tax=Methanosarcina sp. 1.H.T.1A.1 TaxID=1483602 RepID=UPI000622B014|nr:hypothetical protein [Methanosarcina sp. 1.H.T.1A.1]KKI00309.1 hypothetical protein EO95_01195 [Methanosarcina sp. 1.H.T.1A.1]
MEIIKMAMRMMRVYFIFAVLIIATSYIGNEYLGFALLLTVIILNADLLKDLVKAKKAES